MTSRSRKKVRAFAVAVVVTLVLGACAGDDAGASQGTTKLANPMTGPAMTGPTETGPTETGPTETGPTETGPTETGPTETASSPARASAAPDRVKTGMCSDGARWRLEVTDTGNWINVRFEVHQSPVGHEWRIDFRHVQHNIMPVIGHVFFRGIRVASDSGVLVVEPRRPDWAGVDGLVGEAVDRQTGQVCKVRAWYRDRDSAGEGHRSTVTLQLSGSLVAHGEFRSAERRCEIHRPVLIQRRVEDVWRTVATDDAGVRGIYRVRIPDHDGDYRAVIRTFRFHNRDGGTCTRDDSPVVTHGAEG
jgi:hypothetical protein